MTLSRFTASAGHPMFRLPTALLFSLALLVPGLAEPIAKPNPESSAPSIASDPAKPDQPAYKHYLPEALAPSTVAILPPPPSGHSAAEAADKAAFAATRILQNTPRWALATNDVAEGTTALLDDFACVIGQRLEPNRIPALMTLLDRARLDVVRGVRETKRHYRRLRPFVGNQASICVEREQRLADSFSYPSGHASLGWTYALILASLLPEKATQFLIRGRLYGESRVVCGVHWMSDVDAARITASSVFAALQGNAAFRADLERARTELSKALATEGTKPEAAICAREEAAARQSLF